MIVDILTKDIRFYLFLLFDVKTLCRIRRLCKLIKSEIDGKERLAKIIKDEHVQWKLSVTSNCIDIHRTKIDTSFFHLLDLNDNSYEIVPWIKKYLLDSNTRQSLLFYYPRRSGKTSMCLFITLFVLFKAHFRKVLYVAPNSRQGARFIDKVYEAVKQSRFVLPGNHKKVSVDPERSVQWIGWKDLWRANAIKEGSYDLVILDETFYPFSERLYKIMKGTKDIKIPIRTQLTSEEFSETKKILKEKSIAFLTISSNDMTDHNVWDHMVCDINSIVDCFEIEHSLP